MIKGLLQDEFFYCNHLGASERDEIDIPMFSVHRSEGTGLERYIRYNAFPDEDAGVMRTYIVRDLVSDELVGYFSLKAGLFSINETSADDMIEFDTMPGIEIANFAVNSTYIEHNPEVSGVGMIIFSHFIRPIIEEVSKAVGVKAIYLFALPFEKLISRYREYGFSMLSDKDEEALHRRIKPSYDESCIFMYRII